MRAIEQRLTALEQAAEPVNNVQKIVYVGAGEPLPTGHTGDSITYIREMRPTPAEAVAIFDILASAGCVEEVMAHQQIVTG